MLTLPNYQIDSQIDDSVNSLVYRGHRKTDNQPVILKMLKQDYPTPAELTRYRQEYEITQDLDLAGVIKAYGIEKYQNTLVIILEDFGGESLKQFIANRPLTMKEFLPIAIQIADSLGNIHAANIIHKDINPSNIVVNVDTSLLKIIDFGIASRLPRENPTLKNPEQLEGTLAYLSPEQTGRINRSLDYRTDLYSLGVTFYQLLTRHLCLLMPTDAMELVHCHIAKTPIPVGEVNPDVPKIVSDMIMKLMAKNAEKRYQSAFGIKADLEKCLENLGCLSFELAQNDFSGKLQIPQKLYGRDNEIKTLLQAFERVCSGKTEMMLVAGYSGVGKTALVHEVHKPMTEKRGYFAAGKFDQFQRNVPYFALTQAFNGFCDYLLTENAERLAQWQQQILTAVGNNGQVLIEIIPHLELVIGEQPPVASIGSSEALNRFNLVFQDFFQTLCQKEHPFILFIDDLQWADSASLNLLQLLMSRYDSQYFLIIGAYRDNEVDESHSLILMLKQLQDAQVTINTLCLPNLAFQDINDLIADTLFCQTNQAQPLTDLVFEKTDGNAFFIQQFLRTLYEEEVLQFNYSTHQWQWQVEEIRKKGITDNVVELMTRKIEQLPKETQTLLRMAACVGNQFGLETLSILLGQTAEIVLPQLWSAIAENLVLSTDNNYIFRFIHDRVQQAAYGLIPEPERKPIHLRIGRLLLENTPADELDERIFDVVRHLNQGSELLTDSSEIRQLSALNMQAGHRAKASAAYQSALVFYHEARQLSLMDWKADYGFLLELHENAAEAAFLAGSITEMNQLADNIFQHAQNETDKVEIYRLLIQKLNAEGQCVQAIDLGLKALYGLGHPIPHVNSMEEAFKIAREFNETISESFSTLANLPQMTDRTALKAAEMMASLFPCIYTTSRMDIFVLLNVKSLQLYTQFGNPPVAPYLYAIYGFFNFAFLNEVSFLKSSAEITLNLCDKPFYAPNKGRSLFSVAMTAYPWIKPLTESINLLLEGLQASREMGDKEHIAHNANAYVLNSLWASLPLSKVQERALSMLALTQSQQMQIPATWIASSQAVIHNFQQVTLNASVLLSEHFDDHKQLPFLIEANDNMGLGFIFTNKLWLAYLFGHYEACQTLIVELEKYEISTTGFYIHAGGQFYKALALLTRSDINHEVSEKIAQVLENLNFWASTAPMNFQHKVDLIEAERARIEGSHWEAVKRYEKAIQGAKDNEFLQEEALANERFALFWLEQGNETIAKTYLKESLYCYQQWGALAKVKDLEAKYPQSLTARPSTMPESTIKSATFMASVSTRLQTSKWLDLDSVTKAAQALAGEIVLSKLLEKMMHTLIENAGAERGLLILDKEGQWVIEAEGAFDIDQVTVLQSLPIENRLPIALVNYVVRTRQPVVLSNAQREGIYSNDPYIRQHQLNRFYVVLSIIKEN